MNWILYLIGAAAIAWGLSVLEGSQWSFGGVSFYIAGFGIVSGIMIAAFGNVIGLLKSNLRALREILDKRPVEP